MVNEMDTNLIPGEYYKHQVSLNMGTETAFMDNLFIYFRGFYLIIK